MSVRFLSIWHCLKLSSLDIPSVKTPNILDIHYIKCVANVKRTKTQFMGVQIVNCIYKHFTVDFCPGSERVLLKALEMS